MMLLKSIFVLTLHCTCGLAMRLSDSIYITTPPPSVDEHDASQSGIHSDLVAPAPSSLSQYYTEQEYPPTQNYYHQRQQQSAQLSPFLYTGPLILMESPGGTHINHLKSESKNIERSSPGQEKSSYNLYRPKPEENPQFVDMYPPSELQDEPNYYVVKPKKNKKYSATDDKQKKYLKAKESEDLKAKIVSDDYDYAIDYSSDQHHDSNENEEKLIPSSSNHKRLSQKQLNSSDVAISTRLPNESESSRRERDTEKSAEREIEESQERQSIKPVEREIEKSVKEIEAEKYEQSAPTSRLDFQMHGHKGPRSYKFGFDTGKGKNRQFKVEEKDEHGNVLGQYGYYDDKGKFRIVKYSSMANDGFKIL